MTASSRMPSATATAYGWSSQFVASIEKFNHITCPRTGLSLEPESAIINNYYFDENIPMRRRLAYEPKAPNDIVTFNDLVAYHTDYVKLAIYAIPGGVPETFSNINSDAHIWPKDLGPDGSGLKLIHIRDLSSIAADHYNDDPQKLVDDLNLMIHHFRNSTGADNDRAKRRLRNWLRNHLNSKQERPVFATLQSDVDKDISEPDWQIRLYQRLGLAHLQSRKRPVLRLNYRVSEVMRRARDVGASAGMAIPTVLDHKLFEWFFPTPAQPGSRVHPGWAVELGAIHDRTRAREIVHISIEYQVSHLESAAVLDCSSLPIYSLKMSRNSHLAFLRKEYIRPDYGQVMV
jgi:hypothetical protein